MLSPEEETRLDRHLQVMRFIVGAMILGVLTSLIAFVAIRTQKNQPQPQTPLITFIMAGVAAVCVVMSVVVPNSITANFRRTLVQKGGQPSGVNTAESVEPGHVGLWCMAYQTRLIVAAALLEGPAFALGIAYLLEGTLWSLCLVGVLLGLLSIRFPTQAGVQHWIEEQRDLVQRERMAE